MDVLDRADLPFPHSLPEFQRLFPDDAACAAYLEKARWGDGFACPHCGTAGEPFHFENRPGVLRCRKCRQNTGLTVGTVMERSHTPLNVWFWAAYLVASQTPGMSAVQFQRQLGLSRYETAFQILHKLRSGMVRPNQDRIGGQPENHVEVDETWVGGRTRGEGRGVHHKVLVSCAIEVRAWRIPFFGKSATSSSPGYAASTSGHHQDSAIARDACPTNFNRDRDIAGLNH